MPSITSSSAPSTSIFTTSGTGHLARRQQLVDRADGHLDRLAGAGRHVHADASREKADTSETIRLARPRAARDRGLVHLDPVDPVEGQVLADRGDVLGHRLERHHAPARPHQTGGDQRSRSRRSRRCRRTSPPGAARAAGADCSGRSAIPVANATAEPWRLIRMPLAGPLRIVIGRQRSRREARVQTARTNRLLCCLAAIRRGRRALIEPRRGRAARLLRVCRIGGVNDTARQRARGESRYRLPPSW